jgi:hypothetical protein
VGGESIHCRSDVRRVRAFGTFARSPQPNRNNPNEPNENDPNDSNGPNDPNVHHPQQSVLKPQAGQRQTACIRYISALPHRSQTIASSRHV